jgi:hypothetical protein
MGCQCHCANASINADLVSLGAVRVAARPLSILDARAPIWRVDESLRPPIA